MSDNERGRPPQVDLFTTKTRWVNKLQTLPQLPPHLSDSLSTVQRQLDELTRDDALRSYFLLIAQPRILQLTILDQLKNDRLVDAQEHESRRGKILKSHPDAPVAIEFVKTYLTSEDASQPAPIDDKPDIHPGVLFERGKPVASEPIKQEIVENRRISLSPDQRPTTPKGRRTRKKVLIALLNHQEKYPDKLVVIAELAKDIGIGRERTRQIYNELADQGHDLPKRGAAKGHETVDTRVKGFLEQGLSVKEIAEKVGMSVVSIFRSRSRLIKAGDFISDPSKNKYDVLDSQIAELRNKGFGIYAIAESLGIATWQVQNRLYKILIPEGKAKPLRTKRRTEEELLAFDEQVKILRAQGNTDMEVAKILGVAKHGVVYSVKRLLDRNEIPLRQHANKKNRRPEFIALDEKVRELKDQGLTRRQILEQLDITKREIDASITRIFRQAKQQQRTPTIIRQSRPYSKKLEQFDEQVLALRQQGLTSTEIVVQLEASKKRVEGAVRRLLSTGRTERRTKNGKRPIEEELILRQQIKQLRREGLTYKEIAEQLDISRHHVESLVSRLIKSGEIKRKVN